MEENLVMTLSGAGSAAIAVVRLRGPLVAAFLAEHFSRPVAAGRCVHGNILAEGEIVDDAVAVISADALTADLSLHGSPWIARRVAALAAQAGFHAPIDGSTDPLLGAEGLSLLDREVAAALPRARSQLGLAVLCAQPEAWRRFVDERRGVDDWAAAMQAITDDGSMKWLLNPPRVAMAGIANAGKSTLANLLFGRERSITADLPGTTRDWIGDFINACGLPIMLLDTPGIRPACDPIEADAITQSQDEIRQADAIMLVLDRSRSLAEQRELVEAFPTAVKVANKCDLPAEWNSEAFGAIAVCARSGEGVEELRSAIAGRFGWEKMEVDRPRWWTQRQRAILEAAARDPSMLMTLF